MNWYSIFYWLTVADGVKKFFDVFSNIFTVFSVIILIITVVVHFIYGDKRSDDILDKNEQESWKYWLKAVRSSLWIVTIFSVITWAGYVFVPSKKDCLIIVAGGAVGNFITKDTSARQIPTEVMTLLRTKIKSEIESVSVSDVKDTLESLTKEQLIEQLRKK